MCSMNNSFLNRNYTKIAGKPLIKKKELCVYFNNFFAQNKRKLQVSIFVIVCQLFVRSLKFRKPRALPHKGKAPSETNIFNKSLFTLDLGGVLCSTFPVLRNAQQACYLNVRWALK